MDRIEVKYEVYPGSKENGTASIIFEWKNSTWETIHVSFFDEQHIQICTMFLGRGPLGRRVLSEKKLGFRPDQKQFGFCFHPFE